MDRRLVALVLALCTLALMAVPVSADEGDQPNLGLAQWVGAIAAGDDKPVRSEPAPGQLPGKPGAAPGQLPGGGWVTHVDRQYGFSLAIPAEWAIIDFAGAGQDADSPILEAFGELLNFAAVDPTGLTSVNVIVLPAGPGLTLDALDENPADLLASIQEIGTNVEIGRATLPAGDALAITYDMRQPPAGQATFHIHQFILVSNDQAYLLTLGSALDPRQIDPILERIAASFRLL